MFALAKFLFARITSTIFLAGCTGFFGLALCITSPIAVQAQELVSDEHVVMKARVLKVLMQEERVVPGTDIRSIFQKIEAEILDGAERGKVVTIDNDYLSLDEGEVFYVNRITHGLDKSIVYSVKDPDRLPVLFFFAALFLICTVVFGGVQGLRGLISLAGSLFLILYVLLPGILNGYSALWLSVSVSALIIILGSYITHGFNRTTTAAVFGMITTVLCTGGLAYVAVRWGRLSGLASEEAVFLDMSTRGAIDFSGLLLGGILIGLLGVLYDAAIGQAVSVEELHRVAPHLPRCSIYARALRMGREHIGALVDTLAIAYVGVSLPLLLLFSTVISESIGITLNRELFATEIVRTMIGSIGLILTVPITTLISVMFLMGKGSQAPEAVIVDEEKAANTLSVGHHGHSH